MCILLIYALVFFRPMTNGCQHLKKKLLNIRVHHHQLRVYEISSLNAWNYSTAVILHSVVCSICMDYLHCAFQSSDMDSQLEEAKQNQVKLQAQVQHYQKVLTETVSGTPCVIPCWFN